LHERKQLRRRIAARAILRVRQNRAGAGFLADQDAPPPCGSVAGNELYSRLRGPAGRVFNLSLTD